MQHRAGTQSEDEKFASLQAELPARWSQLRDDWTGTFDVVVVPSLSLEGIDGASIAGINRYEERLLFALNLLRHPRARVFYMTSQPIHPATIDYTLSLIGGIPASHMRSRLHVLSAYDASRTPLSQKLLQRPRLLERIARSIQPEVAMMSCFSVSKAERSLALRLGIPLYGSDPSLRWLGSKSGSRGLFRRAHVPAPPGAEDLRDRKDVIDVLVRLTKEHPAKRFAIKHNYGFSGQGNAVIDFAERSDELAEMNDSGRRREIEARMATLRFGDASQNEDRFFGEFAAQQGIVEQFVEHEHGVSSRVAASNAPLPTPSGQLRLTPTGRVELVSTHDQLVEGADGQVYSGCQFPANDAYNRGIQDDTLRVGELLREHGAVGRMGVDFICRQRRDGGWDRYAIEINLRLGGTTHPLMLMKMMTDGEYDPDSGLYYTKRGEPQFYIATDSLYDDSFRGLLVDDLLDIAALRGLHYQPWHEAGVLFHLTGALSEHGKLGMTAIGKSRHEAAEWFERAKRTLLEECAS